MEIVEICHQSRYMIVTGKMSHEYSEQVGDQ